MRNLRRYPEPKNAEAQKSAFTDENKQKEEFRNYDAEARDSVKEFYRLNHRYQCVDFVKQKHEEYLSLQRGKKSIWDGLEYLNTLVDDSDPDTDLTQIAHLLQTSEASRNDGHPRWFILTGLIHDLGKVLCLYGEPQWAVVGDTFPVGCKFSDKIVYPEFFQENPDYNNPEYQTELGIYEEGCGFSNILIPTQYVLIGILAMAGIPYDRWLKFVLPLMIKIGLAASLALVVAVLVDYS